MEIRAVKYLVTGIPARGWLFAVETHFDLLSGRNRQSALASERPKASTIAKHVPKTEASRCTKAAEAEIAAE